VARLGGLPGGSCCNGFMALLCGERVQNRENVETMFKAGIGYDSKKLIDSVRDQVGIR
jgi:hypothetical protein